MDYQYVPTDIYSGQMPGQMSAGGVPAQSVANGQIPYNFPVGQNSNQNGNLYVMNSSNDDTPAAGPPNSVSASGPIPAQVHGHGQVPGQGQGQTQGPNNSNATNNPSNAPSIATVRTGPSVEAANSNMGGGADFNTGTAATAPYYPMQFNGLYQNQPQAYGMQGPNIQNQGMQPSFPGQLPPGPGPYTQGYFNPQQQGDTGNAADRPSNHGPLPVTPQQSGQQPNLQSSQTLQNQQGIRRQQLQHHVPQQAQGQQSTANVQIQSQQPLASHPHPLSQPQHNSHPHPHNSHQQQQQQQVPPTHPPPHPMHGMAPNLGNAPLIGQNPGASPNPALLGLNRAIPSQISSTYPYPLRKYLSNLAILRAHEIINLLNVSSNKLNDMKYWVKVMSELFTPYGLFRYSRKHQEDIRQFEFTAVVIPSVMRAFGCSGVAKLEIVPHQLRAQVLSNGSIFFECPRCLLTYFFPDGSYMTNFTHFKGVFDINLKIEWLGMFTYGFVPGVEWGSLETKLSDPTVSAEIFGKLSTINGKKKSANDSKNNTGKSGIDSKKDKPIKQEFDEADLDAVRFEAMTKLRSQFKVFQNVSSFGIQEGFMRILQVNDVMSYLKNLRIYQKCSGIKSPVETLSTFVNQERAAPSANLGPTVPNTNAEFSHEQSSKAQPTSTGFASSGSSGSTNTAKRRRVSSALSPLSSSERSSLDEKNGANLKKAKY
ncbi:Mfg1p [Kluyveromyces lactis]|uniref:KLLA0D19228p n=1 Tax=Kluyveromyces lactis (strain ATCC 8585 / CBS 2359 / DSM 70799 / NBRC 1267 / NRRL Y-1140 / WM37) TaxID=284590 RepID=Q6CQ74_KLULA|nr:uncharacterized protein KLLA0_D19228g [Kluyveromyces lactis]CAH01011.1 KLLA0D19228p [Kluyveromyces lactis]|eukprot:XP_453915.1 uncharacterized protein KLLA0_D19228g [Kluyveromyces lactis]